MPRLYEAEEFGLTPEEFNVGTTSQSSSFNKSAQLQQRKQEKLGILGNKVGAADNQMLNNLSDSEYQYLVGRSARDLAQPQTAYGEGSGNRWLYSYGSDDGKIKLGTATGAVSDPDARYNPEMGKQELGNDYGWEAGPEGVNTDIPENRMKLLFPEQVANTLEQLGHGREEALDARSLVKPQNPDDQFYQEKEALGGGYTEYYDSKEGFYGDSRDDADFGKEELWSRFLVTTGQKEPEALDTSSENQTTATSSDSPFERLQQTALQKESSGNYRAVNNQGYVGGYQFGAQALEDLGYLKKGASSRGNKIVGVAQAWTGKNGINSLQDFLNNPKAQDKAFEENLDANYQRLLDSGVLDENAPKEEVGGRLLAAHLLGVQGSSNLENTDAYGTSGLEYYELGKRAISQEAEELAEPSIEGMSIKEQLTRQEMAERDGAEKTIYELGQTVVGIPAGIFKGAVDLIDAGQEFLTWPVQSAVRAVTGDKDYDIDLVSDEFKKYVTRGFDETVGYNRTADEIEFQNAISEFEKAGIDITSMDSIIEGLSNPNTRKFLSEGTKMMAANPSFLFSMISEFVGAGGVAGAAAKGVAKATTKVAPKLATKASKYAKSNTAKINEQVYAVRASKLPVAEKAARIDQLEKSYTLGKRLPDIIKGNTYSNADLAIRMNEDIEAFEANNEGEEMSPEKMLQVLTVNRIASALETGALRYEAKIGKIGRDAAQQSLKRAAVASGAHILGSSATEAVQETFDAVVQQLNQKLGSAEYEDKTLKDLVADASAEIIGGAAMGASGGGYVGAATEATKGLRAGSQELTERLQERRAAKEATEEETPQEPVVGEPKENYEIQPVYAANNAVIEGNVGFVQGLQDKIKTRIASGELEDSLKDRTPADGINRVREMATILGYDDEASNDDLKNMIDSAVRALEIDNVDIEGEAILAYLKGQTLNDIEKENPEAGRVYRKVENAVRAGDQETVNKLFPDLKDTVVQVNESAFREMASELVGVPIEDTKYTEKNKTTPTDVLNKAEKAVEKDVDVRKVLKDVRDRNYTFGSSREALDKIEQLSRLGRGRPLVEREISTIASRSELSPEAVALAKKTSEDVEREATTGTAGYETYAKLLETADESTKEFVKNKLRNFWRTQRDAANALENVISRAGEDNLTPNEPLVSEYRKFNGDFFDIRVNKEGKAYKKDIQTARELLTSKRRNLRGIEEAAGIKPSRVAEKPEAVKVDSVPEKPEVEIKKASKPTKTKKVDAVSAIRYAMNAIDKGENGRDVVSGLIAKGLKKTDAERIVKKAKEEEVSLVTEPKSVMTNVLKTSLYKFKQAFRFDEKGIPVFSKKAVGSLQRNPNDYVKISKETTLNSVPVRRMPREVQNISDKANKLLNKIIAPLSKYEKDIRAYGAYESGQSPSRGLIFNTEGNLNDNVVLALRAALVEQVNFDKSLFSKTWKTKDEVARLTGKNSGDDITTDLWNLVKDKGVLYDTIANNLGDKVASLLGLSEKDTSLDVQNFARLKADLGSAAVHIGISEGVLEFSKGDDGKEGIPNTDYYEALDVEVRSPQGRTNFISFVGDAENTYDNEAKVLNENIRELATEKSTYYREEVPKSVIHRRATTVHNDSLGIKPSRTHQKALRKLMNMEWEFDRELAVELLNNRDMLLKNAGYIDEKSTEFKNMSYDKQQSQRGKNRKVLEDVEAIKEMINTSSEGETPSMWFEWYTTVNQRVMMDSNTLNPMNDKYAHRWLIQPKRTNTEVIPKPNARSVGFTNGDGVDISSNVRYALAQAFGFAVDKSSTKEIDRFSNKLLRMAKDPAKLTEIKEGLLKEGKYTLVEDNFEGTYDLKVEHLGHTMQGIKFLENVQKGEAFNTKLTAEFDAVTSGFGLKLLQMPIIDGLMGYLAKVGITVPSRVANAAAKEATSMNDLLDSEGFLDNYETLAVDVKTVETYGELYSNVLDGTDKGSKYAEKGLNEVKASVNTRVWDIMKDVLPKAEDGKVSKELRNMFKDPFMTFNYARSIGNIKSGLATNITEDLVNTLATVDISNKDNSSYVSLLEGIGFIVSNEKIPAKDVQELLRSRGTDNIKVNKVSLKHYLESFVLASYGNEVERIFNEKFGAFIDAQDTVTESFKYVFEVFDYRYKEALKELRNRKGAITTKDKKEIVSDLMDTFPLIDGPLSEEFRSNFEVQYLKADGKEDPSNYTDGSLAIFKQERVSDDSVLGTQFRTNKEVAGVTSRSLQPKVREFATPGVAGTVLPIHSIDSAVLLNTFIEVGDMTLIHDAIIPKLDQMDKSVKEYNRNVFNTNRNYSFIRSVKDMVQRVNSIVREMDESDRSALMNKSIERKPKGWGEDTPYLVSNMSQRVRDSLGELNKTTQDSRAKLFDLLDNDPDVKIMHMVGMPNNVYNPYREVKNARVHAEMLDEDKARRVRRENVRRQEKHTETTFKDMFGDKISNIINDIKKDCE